MPSRRRFLGRLGAAALGLPLAGCAPSAASLAAASAVPPPSTLVKPPRLRPGDLVGLVSPAGAVYEPDDLAVARETLEALGLRVRVGRHALDRRGYLAGTDADRAADLHAMVADDDVRGVVALRGGWGVARMLPLLNYDLFRRHPKVIVGYSDITALLLALYARSGLVTFHGPVGISTWNAFTVDHFRRVLFDAEAAHLANPAGDGLVQTDDRVQTLVPGTAEGPLAGGNLSVLAALLGSDYLPRWDGHLLFLEDVGEDLYRIDRLLTQLRLAGVLDRLAGVVFGRCTRCGPGERYGSLTLTEILTDHLGGLGVPVWYGSMIGHIADKFTLPLGIRARMDADAGTLTLLDAAVG